ncbi:MAG TPA: transposase [Gaiellaceae bacterium]|nr:transposase [Gaiellaceae bacterium]
MVTIGIDAHKHTLAVSLVDELGRELAAREFANEPRAHRALHAWVVKQAPGERRFGVESTGWVGRGIACYLLGQGDEAERLLGRDRSVQATLARRRIEALRRLDLEIRQLEREIAQSVKALDSGLPKLVGISYLGAARIIGEVGDISRIQTKARFARMNGTAPIPASSGKTQRHRLNKGGNRRLNHALHMMALTQARMDPRARAYVERRQSEGRTKRDAVRALKRHLSDAVYQQLRADADRRRCTATVSLT